MWCFVNIPGSNRKAKPITRNIAEAIKSPNKSSTTMNELRNYNLNRFANEAI